MPVENELRCDQGAGWGLWAVQGFVKRSWPREQAGQTSTSLCEQTAPRRGQATMVCLLGEEARGLGSTASARQKPRWQVKS